MMLMSNVRPLEALDPKSSSIWSEEVLPKINLALRRYFIRSLQFRQPYRRFRFALFEWVSLAL